MQHQRITAGQRPEKGRRAPKDSLGSHSGLALANMLSTEQELAIQVTYIDRIQVHDFNLPEP